MNGVPPPRRSNHLMVGHSTGKILIFGGTSTSGDFPRRLAPRRSSIRGRRDMASRAAKANAQAAEAHAGWASEVGRGGMRRRSRTSRRSPTQPSVWRGCGRGASSSGDGEEDACVTCLCYISRAVWGRHVLALGGAVRVRSRERWPRAQRAERRKTHTTSQERARSWRSWPVLRRRRWAQAPSTVGVGVGTSPGRDARAERGLARFRPLRLVAGRWPPDGTWMGVFLDRSRAERSNLFQNQHASRW